MSSCLKVIVPYTGHYHPLAKRAHKKLGAELAPISGVDGYHRLLERLWSEGETFLIVEQDIEPTPDALANAENCGCLWGISTLTLPRMPR